MVGQDKTDSLKTHPVISVKNGASIYSLDESFNEQVRNSNIVKDGTTTVARNNNNRETVTIESVPKNKNNGNKVKSLVDSAKYKKDQETSKKIKKHLEIIEKTKKKQVYITPVSRENLGSLLSATELITLSLNHNDHLDLEFYLGYNEILKRLDFLALQKITAYNSQSLGYTVISHLKVRPPPIA